MDSLENNIKINFCKVCKNKCDNCMNLKVINENGIASYKCMNYCNDTPLEEYKKYIKYDYHDEDGNFIAIINNRTPLNAIMELRKHYDFVRNK
jgi:hypothetical protein